MLTPQKLMYHLDGFFRGRKFFKAVHALKLVLKTYDGKRKLYEGEFSDVIHPLEVCSHLSQIDLGNEFEDFLVVSLLHDISEDYGVGYKVLRSYYGEKVADAVYAISKYKDYNNTTYYKTIHKNQIAALVKGYDRFNNLKSMVGVFSEEKRKKYIEETEQYVLPMLGECMDIYPKYEGMFQSIYYSIYSLLEVFRRQERRGDA